MKIVVITKEKSLYGLRLLNDLKKEGIEASGIVVIRTSLLKDLKLFNSVRKKIGLFDTLIYAIKIVAKTKIDYKRELISENIALTYEQLSNNLYYTDRLNCHETKQYLRQVNPDLMVLGQSGIVRKEILAIPRKGTLNCHPGILPQYRGIDVCKWAAYNKDFKNIGITVHWVNAGIDSGNILLSRHYEFTGNENLNKLEDILYRHCINNLIETVKSLTYKDDKGVPQDPSRARQYYKMPRRLVKIAKRNFKKFITQGQTR